MSQVNIQIRLANAGDDAFILGLIDRFVAFDLPVWRKRSEVRQGIYRDIAKYLADPPPGSFVFVAEDDAIRQVGFLYLQKIADFLTGEATCHIYDIAVTKDNDGKGIGQAFLAFTEQWARDQGCRLITLGVLPGNVRAREFYERNGYGIDLIRMAKPVVG